MEELELGSVRRMDEGGLKGSSAFLLTRRKRKLKYSRSSSLISCKTAEEEDAAQICWQAIVCFPWRGIENDMSSKSRKSDC